MEPEHLSRLKEMVAAGEDQSHILELFRFYKYSDEAIMHEIVLAQQAAPKPAKKAGAAAFETSAMSGYVPTYTKPKDYHKPINWIHIIGVIIGLALLSGMGYYVYTTSSPLGEAPAMSGSTLTVLALNCSATGAILNVYNPSMERTGSADLSILENNATCGRADLQANLKVEAVCEGNFSSGKTYSLVSGIFRPEVFRCP